MSDTSCQMAIGVGCSSCQHLMEELRAAKAVGRIESIQQAFRAAGFQWREQIFNDGRRDDCFIEFTKATDPSALTTYPKPPDCVGWGRFQRWWAWAQAEEWLKDHLSRQVGSDPQGDVVQ